MQFVLYLFFIIWVVGFLGNVLSAIVWLRRQVATKNSSTVYLAALAINDIVHLLTIPTLFLATSPDFWETIFFVLTEASFSLEPLLVLGFSVERLIAILYPLQVRICSA